MSEIHFRPYRYLKSHLRHVDNHCVVEVGMVADDESAVAAVAIPRDSIWSGPGAQPADLLGLHESIAGLLATQGDWRRAYHHLRSALDIARAGSLRDTLTSSFNRRYLDQRLHSRRERRENPALAIALIDLDRFKRVNDTYGHLVGDRVLRRVADLLQEELPPDGFCARYGGEEFVLWLPGVDAEGAIRIADAARLRVAHHPWSELQPGLHVTISAGLAHEPGAEQVKLSSPERQLRCADTLLYAAKRAGRNKVAYRDEAGRPRVITHSE